MTNAWRSCLSTTYESKRYFTSNYKSSEAKYKIKNTQEPLFSWAELSLLLRHCGSTQGEHQETRSSTSDTASSCHIFSAIKHWSGYELDLLAFPVTHLPKHFSTKPLEMVGRFLEKTQNVTLSSFCYHTFITFWKTLIVWHGMRNKG